MYKLYPVHPVFGQPNIVFRLSDSSCIPFDPANTDYAEFKKAVAEGAELQDADGNVMSPQAAQDYVRSLP
jgi:hypothetical protein